MKLDGLKDVLAAGYIGYATAGTAAVAVPPGSPPWWGVVVLGIPLGVLAAALVGASIHAFRDGVKPDKKIPHHALGVTFDGFVGGWLAMFLVGFSFTHEHVKSISPEILGGFGGLLVEFIRSNGKRWFEQFYSAILSRLSKKPTGEFPQ